MRPRKINGYPTTIEQACHRASDDSLGDAFNGKCRDGETLVWRVTISNGFYHLTTLGPFDSERDAESAAKKWTANRKKEDQASAEFSRRQIRW